jgi:hypothetical protein
VESSARRQWRRPPRSSQLATGRPDSYVPARTLAHLLRLPDPDRDRWTRNMAMHYLAGATVGAVRGLMSVSNLRGPLASLMHANLRLSFDQTLENATGVGAPPWTWPRDELLIDVAHKARFTRSSQARSPMRSFRRRRRARHGGAALGRARRGWRRPR